LHIGVSAVQDFEQLPHAPLGSLLWIPTRGWTPSPGRRKVNCHWWFQILREDNLAMVSSSFFKIEINELTKDWMSSPIYDIITWLDPFEVCNDFAEFFTTLLFLTWNLMFVWFVRFVWTCQFFLNKVQNTRIKTEIINCTFPWTTCDEEIHKMSAQQARGHTTLIVSSKSTVCDQEPNVLVARTT